jgi:hypothetical protein
MHKSGTTLVSQILNSSGIDMGEFDPDVHYDRGNKYERAESLALDMDILGMDSYDVLNLPHSAPSSLTQDQREGIQSIVSACEAKHSDWGMKDPRMCMTYHLWAKLRGIVNNPGRAHTYQRLWIEHNRGILAALESGAAENIVLHYHELMTEDREFQRLQTFVGHDLNDLRKPEMYRSRSEPDLLMKTTGWWLKKQTGLTTDGIFSKLVEYRSRQIEAEAGP